MKIFIICGKIYHHEKTKGPYKMPNIININDLNSPDLDIYARFSEAQLLNREHPENGIFIAESPLVIGRALDAGCVPLSALVEDRHINGEGRDIIARLSDIPVYTAPFDILTELTGFKLTRGMLCAMRRPKPLDIDALLSASRRIAILENVMNPTNIGAIIRSAAALGMDAVLLTPACSDPLYRRAIRVSMGTVFQIPWAHLHSWNEETLLYLKEKGYKTAAMALSDNSVSIKDERVKASEKLAVILGTEGEGLAATTIAKCDFTVKIPMYHGVDSLNVAAASAVAFYELAEER